MSELVLYRSFAPVELEGDGRTVVGLAAPYDEVALVDDGEGPYRECYDRGAFTSVVARWPARRCKVQLEHPKSVGMGTWVGRGQEWRDTPEGLRVVLRLDDTEDGRVAAYKIRDGQTPALSLAYVPGHSDTRWHPELADDVVHRATVRAISHVALVPVGAYGRAQIEAVRSHPDPNAVDRPPSTVHVPTLEVETPRRDALEEWLATMRTSPPAATPPASA